MIFIPWDDHDSALACCLCGKFGIDYAEIADFGFLGVYGNRLFIHLMNDMYPTNINDAIAYDLNELSYSCSHHLGSLFEYVKYACREKNAKVWNGDWSRCTVENLGLTCNTARDISKSLIGYVTGMLDLNTSLAILMHTGILPPMTYRWSQNKLDIKCFGKIITLEEYLSFLP